VAAVVTVTGFAAGVAHQWEYTNNILHELRSALEY
jgi:hypothetical protein